MSGVGQNAFERSRFRVRSCRVPRLGYGVPWGFGLQFLDSVLFRSGGV